MKSAPLAALAALNASCGSAFYLPGSSPVSYEEGAVIPITVNKLTSPKTQMPYDYYSLAYCKPNAIERQSVNLGSILKGDAIVNTPYEVKMQTEESCKVLCSAEIGSDSIKRFVEMISEAYTVNILADDLPAALRLNFIGDSHALFPGSRKFEERVVVTGFPVGSQEAVYSGKTESLLVNHLDFLVKYHNVAVGARVVGFEVIPRSVNQKEVKPGQYDCDSADGAMVLKPAEAKQNVIFTYSVKFEESPVAWATRWDVYLSASSKEAAIHWFSIIDGLLIVLLLSSFAIVILFRTVLKDIARYNNLDDVEEAEEETGWKLVHGDVFRRPRFSRLLAAFAGVGVQLLIMLSCTIALALLGVLSPANRGSLLEAGLLLFAFMGAPAGFIAARLNKVMMGETVSLARSVFVTGLTALLFPGVCFLVFFILNFVLWTKGSSGAVPFATMFVLLLLWFGVSAPLVTVGAYMGYKRDVIDLPARVNQIPRQIPAHSFSSNPMLYTAMSGVLPLGVAMGELLSIMSSVWNQSFYYLFGFLSLVMILTVVTAALVSVISTYFGLVHEDYRWWWRSFLSAGSSGIYLFGFYVLQFFTIMDIGKFGSALLYFGYTLLLCLGMSLCLGAVGFISSFYFVRGIYSSIKID